MKRDGGNPAEGRYLYLRAQKISGLRNAIYLLPEIRPHKVDAIEKSLAEGTYETDSEKIAIRLLEEAIMTVFPFHTDIR